MNLSEADVKRLLNGISPGPFKNKTITLDLTCEKCKKHFPFSYSYPEGFPEPCMQGLIPRFCPECR